MLLDQREEPPLECAEGDGRVALQDPPKLGRAGAIAAALEDRGDLCGRRLEADPGLVAGTGEGIEGEVRGEVDKRARHGGDRDAAVDSAVRAVDEPAPHADALDASLAGRCDLRRRGRALE